MSCFAAILGLAVWASFSGAALAGTTFGIRTDLDALNNRGVTNGNHYLASRDCPVQPLRFRRSVRQPERTSLQPTRQVDLAAATDLEAGTGKAACGPDNTACAWAYAALCPEGACFGAGIHQGLDGSRASAAAGQPAVATAAFDAIAGEPDPVWALLVLDAVAGVGYPVDYKAGAATVARYRIDSPSDIQLTWASGDDDRSAAPGNGVPEPATFALVGLAGLASLIRLRRS